MSAWYVVDWMHEGRALQMDTDDEVFAASFAAQLSENGRQAVHVSVVPVEEEDAERRARVWERIERVIRSDRAFDRVIAEALAKGGRG